ncbi:MAG TPA: hypothetical protein VF026_12520 [Ktedonobacteraceae bacterium]
MGPSGATPAHLSVKMMLERLQDFGERLQLFGGQCVSKMLFDGPQVGRTRAPECRRAVVGERDLGAAIVGGAVVTPDEAALLHPAQVMGQAAALPLDDRRQFGRAQPPAIGFFQRQQHLVVAGRETRLLELRTQNPAQLGRRIEQGTPDFQLPSRQPRPPYRTSYLFVATHVVELLMRGLYRPLL